MISWMIFCSFSSNFHFFRFPSQVYHRVSHFILQFSRIFSFAPVAISVNYSLFRSEMRQGTYYFQIFSIMELFQITFIYIFIHESIFTILCAFFDVEVFPLPIQSQIDTLFFVEYPILYAIYGKFFSAIGFSSLHFLEYMGFCLAEYQFSIPCFHFYYHEYFYNFFMTMPSLACLKIIQYSGPQGLFFRFILQLKPFFLIFQIYFFFYKCGLDYSFYVGCLSCWYFAQLLMYYQNEPHSDCYFPHFYQKSQTFLLFQGYYLFSEGSYYFLILSHSKKWGFFMDLCVFYSETAIADQNFIFYFFIVSSQEQVYRIFPTVMIDWEGKLSVLQLVNTKILKEESFLF